VESLRLFQEPLEPAARELESLELPEDASLVDFGVVCELRAFDERKDDGVFEAVEDGSDPLQGERVFCERVVGLHRSSTSCCGRLRAVPVRGSSHSPLVMSGVGRCGTPSGSLARQR